MIDEIIEKEKEHIQSKLDEYEQFEGEKERAIQSLNELEHKIDLQINELENEIQRQKTYLVPYKEFNIFQRIFSREYREYKKGINNNQVIREKAKEINKKILELENEKQKIMEQKETVISKSFMIDYNSLSEEIQTLNNRRKAIHFLFHKYHSLGQNIEFIKEAIDEDLVCIIYDETNDVELYKVFLNKILYTFPQLPEETKNGILGVLNEFNNPKEVEEGKYKIPHKYLCEAIRNKIRDVIDTCCMDQEKIYKPYEFYQLVNLQNNFYLPDLSIDGKYSKEFGEELEELYSDKNTYLCCHGTHSDVNLIMKNGLNYMEGEGSFKISNTAAYKNKLDFLKALDYSYRLESNVILCKIPKNGLDKTEAPIKIWGSDTSDPAIIEANRRKKQDMYILPKYIYGYMTPKEDGEKRRIVKNTHEEERKYKYTYYDVATGIKNTIQTIEQEK